jgi:hypothetical protein
LGHFFNGQKLQLDSTMDQHMMEGHNMEAHMTAHGGGELPNNDNASTFCHGNGMIMYMDGMV